MSFAYPAGARRYEQFRSSIWSRGVPVAREGSPDDREDEIALQAQWFGGEFGRDFTGTDGERVEIVQFGHWNRGAGPDFTHCAMRVDGELRTGSIEIDRHATDWEGHGHGANPAFDEVILHVFTDTTALRRFFTRTSRHGRVCQVLLPQYSGLQGPPDFLPEAFPGRCTTPLRRMNDEEVASLLAAAAQFRFHRKSERLRIMARATDPVQALFQGMAETFGFRQNRTSMAILAQRNPIRLLLREGEARREAHLFGSAGFLCGSPAAESVSPESGTYLRALWEEWWKVRPDVEVRDPQRAVSWVSRETRPHNHPQRRLGALASLANRWPEAQALCEDPRIAPEREWHRYFASLRHSYWEHHFTLNSAPVEKRMKLIGRERQRDILGNLVYPWQVARSDSAWESFLQMRGGGSNRPLRRALLRLFGEDTARAREFSRLYHQQQGLLQIYRDFCLEDHSECAECPFPEQVMQWKGGGAVHPVGKNVTTFPSPVRSLAHGRHRTSRLPVGESPPD